MPTQLTLDDALSGEISTERMREILRLLNDYEYRGGPNVFEDVAYGLPEYDRSATDATYPEHVYSFVLTDGTRVERSEDHTVRNGLTWTARRVAITDQPEKEGEFLGNDDDDEPIYGNLKDVWHMDDSGSASRWDGTTWREEKE